MVNNWALCFSKLFWEQRGYTIECGWYTMNSLDKLWWTFIGSNSLNDRPRPEAKLVEVLLQYSFGQTSGYFRITLVEVFRFLTYGDAQLGTLLVGGFFIGATLRLRWRWRGLAWNRLHRWWWLIILRDSGLLFCRRRWLNIFRMCCVRRLCQRSE